MAINYKDEIGMEQSPDALAGEILRLGLALSRTDAPSYAQVVRALIQFLPTKERSEAQVADPWLAPEAFALSPLWEDTERIITALRHEGADAAGH